MIRFDGIKAINKVHFIAFINDQGSRVEIPIDGNTAKTISMHLEKITIPPAKFVEHQNDEPSG